MSIDALWSDWLAKRTIASRDALVLALLPLVEADVLQTWIFAKSVVRSEASMQILLAVEHGEPVSVGELGKRTRGELYKDARFSDAEQERLRKLTEEFGSDTSEWKQFGDAE